MLMADLDHTTILTMIVCSCGLGGEYDVSQAMCGRRLRLIRRNDYKKWVELGAGAKSSEVMSNATLIYMIDGTGEGIKKITNVPYLVLHAIGGQTHVR